MEEEILYSVKVEGVVSIENLTKANKALREERKSLDLQSAEGQKRVEEINKSLDKNTEMIKQNVSALEKQKINIGNYKSALDGVIPGFGAMTSGIESSTTAAKAFIATPLGAVIGALGLAIAALTAYFKGSEAGQDKFGRAMQVGKMIFQQLTVVVEGFGEVVSDTLGFLFDGFEKLINFVSPALGKLLDDTIKTGTAIAMMEEELGDIEDDLILKRAETAKKVAELRSKAISLEGAAKRKAVEEAIKLEEELAAKEVELAQKSLDYFLADQKSRGAITGEEKTRIAELKAAVIDAEAQKFQATLRFTKELEKLNEQAAKDREKQNELLSEETRLKNDLATVNDRLLEQSEIEIPFIEAKINSTAKLGAALETLKNKNKEAAEQEKENARVAQESKDKQLKAAVSLSAAVIGLGKADTAAKKFLGLTTIGINSGIGVSEAIKAGAGKPWPLNLAAILSGVTAVLTGISQAKGLLGFANGGLTGTRIMSHHGQRISRGNGDNLLATVKTGEVILNERQQNALGGARTFAKIGVPGFASGGFVSSTARASESSLNFNQMIQALTQVPIVVTVEDINAGVSRVDNIVNRARVI